jgi:SAM-dependent methyltransferase
MTDWAGGYVVDLEYTRGFYRDQAPLWLSTAAVLAGRSAPDPHAPYTYCELACGQGITTLVLAAANPHAQFWATDINPAHVASARALAEAAGLTNVRFFDDGFADFAARDLPAFDYVTLHGIYTWVAPAVRAEIVAFLKRHLKPGGLAYVSYNCMPGWATMAPVRRLLVEAAARSGARSSAARLDHALGIVKGLIEAGTGYPQVHPDVKQRLEKMTGMQRSYLVHEFMNQDWHPMYFPDVVEELAEAKLGYVGSSTLLDLFDETAVPEKAKAVLAGATDETMRQLLRDFVVNRQFRCDIHARGAIPLTPVAQMRRVLGQSYALVRRRDLCQMKIAAPVGEVTLPDAVYGPLLDALATGPVPAMDLPRRAGLSAISDRDLYLAVRILLGGGHIQPAATPENRAAAAAPAAACNRALFDSLLAGREVPVVVAPTLAGGIALTGLDQTFLLATGSGQDPARWVADQFARNGIQVQVTLPGIEQKPLPEKLAAYGALFGEKVLPFLRALGL